MPDLTPRVGIKKPIGTTKATIALYEKDPDGWSVGCEMYHPDCPPYMIFSLHLLRSEFPSKRSDYLYVFINSFS